MINKNLVIQAEGANINITGGGQRVFEVTSGTSVEFSGLSITAGTAMNAAAINNPGTVILRNVMVEKNPGVMGATLIENTLGGQLLVYGTCFIYQ